MHTATAFTEALESRTLLSASPASTVLSAAVRADQLQVRVDLLQFRSDAISRTSTLLQDVTAIKADELKNAKTVKPLVAKFRHDLQGMWSQLRLDRLTERQNALADESVLVGDRRQILLDKGKPAAETADHAKQLADRIKLQNDLLAGLDSRLATRANDMTAIFNDGQAIVAAAQSDPNVSPKLTADLTKWTADRATCISTVSADIQKLIGDRQQLVMDLTAMQAT